MATVHDVKYFQQILLEAGITEQEFDLGNYIDCSSDDLSRIVAWKIKRKELDR